MKILSTIIALSMICSQENTIQKSSHGVIHPSHDTNDEWEQIQSDASNGIKIEWIKIERIDWVRTSSTFQFSIDKVSQMIEDKSNYYNIFDRVVSSDAIGNDIVHIRIDMPFPISDRDYIVRYAEDKSESSISYKFVAVDDPGIPETNGCIRLIHAAGEWHLIDEGKSTKIIYTWNGELRGDFPDFALTRAWLTQGNEMITWLSESLTELYGE